MLRHTGCWCADGGVGAASLTRYPIGGAPRLRKRSIAWFTVPLVHCPGKDEQCPVGERPESVDGRASVDRGVDEHDVGAGGDILHGTGHLGSLEHGSVGRRLPGRDEGEAAGRIDRPRRDASPSVAVPFASSTSPGDVPVWPKLLSSASSTSPSMSRVRRPALVAATARLRAAVVAPWPSTTPATSRMRPLVSASIRLAARW